MGFKGHDSSAISEIHKTVLEQFASRLFDISSMGAAQIFPARVPLAGPPSQRAAIIATAKRRLQGLRYAQAGCNL
jgi:hypothetical protein